MNQIDDFVTMESNFSSDLFNVSMAESPAQASIQSSSCDTPFDSTPELLDSYYDCPCCDFFEPSYALLFPWVIELIGIVTSFILIQTNSPVPFAAIMFLVGAGLGGIATWHQSGCCNAFILSTLQWTQIDSNVLLLTILPGLILRDAMEVDFDVFMLASGQLLVLAYPMVLIGTVLTGAAAYYYLPWDWPWSLTLTLGSILGSTDPIAVASVLKRLGAPPRLQLHLSGESTLNDGSAMVFFNVFSQIWFASLPDSTEEEISVGEGFALFFQNALGGLAIGIAFAIGLLLLLHQLHKRLEPEYDVLQAGAAATFSYLSYYVADQLLSMSGVTASVACAILAKAFGTGMMQDEQGMIHYLSLMEFLLNTLLFALGGVVWGGIVVQHVADNDQDFTATEEWLWLFVMYLIVMVIRAIQVATVYPILSRIGLMSDIKEAAFLSFAGMRGAVGIALALSLYRRAKEMNYEDGEEALLSSIFFISGGISLFTLLFNGTAAPWVLKKLSLIEPDDRKRAVQLFEVEAEKYISVQCKKLLSHPRFHGASRNAIQKHVPFITFDSKEKDETPLSQSPDKSIRGRPNAHRRGHSRNISDVGDIEVLQQQMSHRIRQVSHLSDGFLEGTSENTDTDKDAVMTEMRHMFLDMVYHIYVRKLQEGEIDDDHNMQNNPAWMKQNLNNFFASDSKASDSQRETAGQLASTETTEYWWNRLERTVKRIITKKGKSSGDDLEAHSKNMEHVRSSRPIIQRTLAFIGAHRVAEHNFELYMRQFLASHKKENQNNGIVESATSSALHATVDETSDNAASSGQNEPENKALRAAVEKILEESQEQIQIARNKLSSLPAKDVRRVQSHTVASILLKRLTKFVAAKVTDDSLTPKEAQVYLDRIHNEKEGLQECTGEEIAHPEASIVNELERESIVDGYLEIDDKAKLQ